jgi:hypothetical protein
LDTLICNFYDLAMVISTMTNINLTGDIMNIKTFLGSLAVVASAFSPALAQTYPAKTINLIVPYPAGGPSDFFARKVQPDAAAKLGQP